MKVCAVLPSMFSAYGKPVCPRLHPSLNASLCDQVTQAPLGTFVVVHLHQSYVEGCSLLNQLMATLAVRAVPCHAAPCRAAPRACLRACVRAVQNATPAWAHMHTCTDPTAMACAQTLSL